MTRAKYLQLQEQMQQLGPAERRQAEIEMRRREDEQHSRRAQRARDVGIVDTVVAVYRMCIYAPIFADWYVPGGLRWSIVFPRDGEFVLARFSSADEARHAAAEAWLKHDPGLAEAVL